MTNKQQYVERKKYKKEQIYDAIAKRIREICDLTDSVTSAECLKNTLLRMGYEIICTNDISRYNDRYELIPKFDKTYQIKVPFVSREYEIEVVTDSIDSAALKQEKELLLKRIKEIDHLLNCGE